MDELEASKSASQRDANRNSGVTGVPDRSRETSAPFGGLKNKFLALLAGLLVAAVIVVLFNRQAPVASPSLTEGSGIGTSVSANQENRLTALETRLSDAQQVNRVLREQSLALVQRLELVEQSLARVGSRAAPAADAIKWDEAQYLLMLAQTRLELFYDPTSALKALERADQLLASIDEPRLAQVRQTLAIEIEAVRTAPINDLPVLSSNLHALVEDVAALPVMLETRDDAQRGRLLSILDRYLVIRRDGDAMPTIGRSAWAVRESVLIELERAQLALEKQQGETWRQALNAASALARRGFTEESTLTQLFLERLKQLADTQLAPEPPKIGLSLRELRRLHDTLRPGSAANALPDSSAVPLPRDSSAVPLPRDSSAVPLPRDSSSEQSDSSPAMAAKEGQMGEVPAEWVPPADLPNPAATELPTEQASQKPAAPVEAPAGLPDVQPPSEQPAPRVNPQGRLQSLVL